MMSPNLRRALFLVGLLVFLAALIYGARYRTFDVYTKMALDGEVFVLPNSDVPEYRLNIATTFGGASVGEDRQLQGNPYDWVNTVGRPCPT